MRPDLFADLFEKEESYWWHVSRREIVVGLVNGQSPHLASGKPAIGLDLGCGAGYTVKFLEGGWRMIGADKSRTALDLCRRRGIRRLCELDVNHGSLPFKSGSFDLIVALDVLEHVERDAGLLRECARVLKAGGLLILTVPAFMALWSPWDEALGHLRRYTASRLLQTCREAGLLPLRSTYAFFFVFPLAVLVRGIKRLTCDRPESYATDFIPLPAALNRFLIGVGRLELWLIKRLGVNLPVGLSVVSLLTKRTAAVNAPL